MALTLYELPPSPNSIKIRLALGLKQIECERKTISPMDRSTLVEVSGQPLAPVLVDGDSEGGGRVVFDSFAIMRYLDANNRDQGPRLYSADREAIRAIEDWESYARNSLGEVIGMIFGQAFAPEKDPSVIERANVLLNERVVRVEEALGDSDYLTGDAPNAADLTAAPFLLYGTLDPANHSGEGEGFASIQAFFANHLRLGEAPKTRAWIARVMELDVAG
jgi:glutathione S-transferase